MQRSCSADPTQRLGQIPSGRKATPNSCLRTDQNTLRQLFKRAGRRIALRTFLGVPHDGRVIDRAGNEETAARRPAQIVDVFQMPAAEHPIRDISQLFADDRKMKIRGTYRSIFIMTQFSLFSTPSSPNMSCFSPSFQVIIAASAWEKRYFKKT